jgi:glycosyltransferase involved in cell wall biosynthesis
MCDDPSMRRHDSAASCPGRAVLYVNHTSVIGGAEHALLEHLRIMPSVLGAGPVLCPSGELADELKRRGIHVIAFRGTAVSFRFTVRSLARGAVDLAASAWAIRQAARESGCQVVHANSIRAGLLACFARLIGGPPVVVHVHDVLPPGPVARIVRWLLLRRAGALVAVSNFTRAAFVEGLLPSRTPFPVIHNPLDVEGLIAHTPQRADARAALALPDAAPVLGIVGQITPWKRQHTVIEAMPKVLEAWPDAQLLIVGEPRFVDPSTRYDNRAYRAELDTLVERLGLSGAVRFLGHRDDVPVVMRALDLMLLPSSLEPLARVALEAMVLGTPILATIVGGLPEVIEEGQTGFLAPPGDVAAWAARIVELLADRPQLAAISERARDNIVARVGPERYVEQMMSLYAQVQRQSSRRGSEVDAATQQAIDMTAAESAPTAEPLAGRASDANRR